jgi:C4-dicarboxylate transporter
MTTDTDAPRPQDRDHRELRLVLLLLALLVGLLITAAAVYVARVHPTLAQPLGVGAAVMSALAAIAGVVARTIRR